MVFQRPLKHATTAATKSQPYHTKGHNITTIDNQHTTKRTSDAIDVSTTSCNVKRARSDGTPRHIVQFSVENTLQDCFDIFYVPYECFPEFMQQRIASHYTDPLVYKEDEDGVIFRDELNKGLKGELKTFLDTMNSKSQTRDFDCIKLSFLILMFES